MIAFLIAASIFFLCIYLFQKDKTGKTKITQIAEKIRELRKGNTVNPNFKFDKNSNKPKLVYAPDFIPPWAKFYEVIDGVTIYATNEKNLARKVIKYKINKFLGNE